MNLIISLVYAPIVFILLRYFDIENISIFLLLFSCFWFLLTLKKSWKERLFPMIYIIFSIATFFFKEFLILKAMPLSISIIFTLIILISYINKNSIILYFAKKFSKTKIDAEEEIYIHKSTLFWIIISSINILIHLNIFIYDDITFWVYYSSIGWYFLFFIGGILQMLHRKFVFLKGKNV